MLRDYLENARWKRIFPRIREIFLRYYSHSLAFISRRRQLIRRDGFHGRAILSESDDNGEQVLAVEIYNSYPRVRNRPSRMRRPYVIGERRNVALQWQRESKPPFRIPHSPTTACFEVRGKARYISRGLLLNIMATRCATRNYRCRARRCRVVLLCVYLCRMHCVLRDVSFR